MSADTLLTASSAKQTPVSYTAEIAEAHGGSTHQGAVQDASEPVMGAGVGLVEQEHRTEQHRTGVQLVPDALQAGQQAAEEGAVRQTHLTREEEGDEPAR